MEAVKPTQLEDFDKALLFLYLLEGRASTDALSENGMMALLANLCFDGDEGRAINAMTMAACKGYVYRSGPTS